MRPSVYSSRNLLCRTLQQSGFAVLLLSQMVFCRGAERLPDPHPQASLQDSIVRFISRTSRHGGTVNPEVSVFILFPKESIAKCQAPYEVTMVDARMLNRLKLDVRCPGSSLHWLTLVRASIKADVVVTARPIPAGRVLTADALSVERRYLPSLTGTVMRTPEAVGKTSRRALPSRSIIMQRYLRLPELVHIGERVRLMARFESGTVESSAIALRSGILGATIPIRNARSRRTMMAQITGTGMVTIIASAPPSAARPEHAVPAVPRRPKTTF